ncbi:MAG TPA: hypothetical protein VNO17_11810 [Actinomycetota bacterium]|nr:hypothetical protein [Actinomycetota bacterium]
MYLLGLLTALLGLASGALALLLVLGLPLEAVLPPSLSDRLLLPIDPRWGEELLAAAAAGAALFLGLATALFVAGFRRSRRRRERPVAGDAVTLEARSRLLRERLVFLEDRVAKLERSRTELEARKQELEREVAELEDALERRRQALRLGDRGNVVVIPEPPEPIEPEGGR